MENLASSALTLLNPAFTSDAWVAWLSLTVRLHYMFDITCVSHKS